MASSHVIVFLLSITVMLFFAKLFGELFIKLKQPAIIGEILAGIILGPTVFGNINPEAFSWLFPEGNESRFAIEGIVTLAVIMLLLVSGMEVDLSVVIKNRTTAVSTSVFGIIFPFILGFGVSYLFPDLMGIKDESQQLVFALFIGTALAISSLPVIAKILLDLNIFKTPIGYIIISSAMLNDIIGWLIFSIILGMIGVNTHGFTFAQTLVFTLIFIVVTLLLLRRVIDKILPIIQTKFSFPGSVINFVLITGFAGAIFTEYIGIHAILGAFIMGIAIGDSAKLEEKTREIIQQFVTNIFAPLFFVSIGLRVNFIESFNIWIVLILLVLTLAGKFVGCGLGARIGGLNKSESLTVAAGMSSSGAMGIILGLIALQFGLIHEDVFVGLVIMALFTSIASAPLMNYFMKEIRKLNFVNLMTPNLLIFTNANSKEEIIRTLVNLVSENVSVNKNEIMEKVFEREKLISTGIANYLAIPHAKIKIIKPIVAVAVNDKGINFEAEDKLDSRVIVLLLTPVDDNQVQLKLLSEIAGKFRSREKAENLFSLKDKNEMLKAIEVM